MWNTRNPHQKDDIPISATLSAANSLAPFFRRHAFDLTLLDNRL
jgi:hypothetical protein